MKKFKINIKLDRFDIFFLIILLVISILLFIGSFEQGMQFDEVYRYCNIYSLFSNDTQIFNQSIYNIGNIPIMYKDYLSSALLIPYIPLLLFKDPLIGIRTLHYIYYILPLIIFYLSLKEYNRRLAAISVFMIAVNPILFPEIRIKFAYTWQLIAISFLIVSMKKSKLNNKIIFLNAFLLGLTANITFYFVWDLTAIFVISFLLYYDFWKKVFKNFIYILSLLLGFILGLFNFLIYNIFAGFPTVKRLIESIFFRDKYNENPIDYKVLGSLNEQMQEKVRSIYNFMGEGGYAFKVFSIALFIILLFLIIIIVYYIVNKQTKSVLEYRIYLTPVFIFILVFLFIMISPNATMTHHFSFLIPYSVLTLTCGSYLIVKFAMDRFKSILKYIVSIIIISVSFTSLIVTTQEIIEINKTGGTGNFSPAIFELKDYISKNQIQGDDMLFINWGFHSQLYFLSKGNFKIHEIVFKLLNKDEEYVYQSLINYFVKEQRDEIFIPIYTKVNSEGKIISKNKQEEIFIDFVNLYGGNLQIDKNFYERDGNLVFTLYKLSDIYKIRENITGKMIINQSNKKEVIETYATGAYNIEEDGSFWVDDKFSANFEINEVEDFIIAGWIPYLNGVKESLYISFYINNTLIDTKEYLQNSSFKFVLPVDNIQTVSNNRNFKLTLISDYSFIPKELGVNDDIRKLSYKLNFIGY